jgi:hypothetical protein
MEEVQTVATSLGITQSNMQKRLKTVSYVDCFEMNLLI